jgi:hypothetical protein
MVILHESQLLTVALVSKNAWRYDFTPPIRLHGVMLNYVEGNLTSTALKI